MNDKNLQKRQLMLQYLRTEKDKENFSQYS